MRPYHEVEVSRRTETEVVEVWLGPERDFGRKYRRMEAAEFWKSLNPHAGLRTP